jgi:uncharacterized protein
LEALGPDAVLAVTAASPLCFTHELEVASQVTDQLGAPYRVVETAQLEDPALVENTPRRCYFCKRRVLSRLIELARLEGLAQVVEGSNVDDQGDYRPGAQAVRELGVRSPLLEAGLTKAEIRALSRRAGLPTWDRTSQTCLATRLPYGTPITAEALGQVAAAEALLRELGFDRLRVRHHGPIARIEVPPAELGALVAPEVAERVAQGLKDLGYTYVTVDLEGYRRGSLLDEVRDNTPGRTGGS